MQTEYEATFVNIDKDEIREKLKKVGAVLVKPEVLMKRYVFNLPQGHDRPGAFARVRDEGDKITLSFKVIARGGSANIEDQKELCLTIDNFDNAVEFLKELGCTEKAYQESKREIWKIGETEICIDEWPFLEPFIEVEGPSEQEVKDVSEKLGFDYSQALFCAVGTIYAKKYGKYNVSEMKINNQTPRIVFDMENPFLDNKIKSIANKQAENYAFIDGQNLHLGIKSLGWRLDYKKFRIYLREKYQVEVAYLFLGYIAENKELYSFLQKVGYVLIFKPVLSHDDYGVKGNVDADLVLQAMVDLPKYQQAIIITSDGDFYCLVKYLHERSKLKIVMSPYVKTCSVLLKQSAKEKIIFMDNLKKKLEHK